MNAASPIEQSGASIARLLWAGCTWHRENSRLCSRGVAHLSFKPLPWSLLTYSTKDAMTSLSFNSCACVAEIGGMSESGPSRFRVGVGSAAFGRALSDAVDVGGSADLNPGPTSPRLLRCHASPAPNRDQAGGGSATAGIESTSGELWTLTSRTISPDESAPGNVNDHGGSMAGRAKQAHTRLVPARDNMQHGWTCDPRHCGVPR